jgi:broad specificity phosphatase PhoE
MLIGFRLLLTEAFSEPALVEPTTVLLVRHADRADDSLTPEGRVRAQSLYNVVEKARVKAVFASNTERSEQTVEPTFKILRSLDPSVKLIVYEYSSLDKVSARVLADYSGKVVLVAAHSDTAKKLVTKFGGNAENCSIGVPDEYDNLCVVTVYAPSKSNVVNLQYGEMSPLRAVKVTLNDTESYDFSTRSRGQYAGGDLYFRSSPSKFLANNLNQRGVKDVTGELGDVNLSLHKVRIPTSGYTRFGVSVVADHTYVALAQQGEEGNYIVFRVKKVTPASVDLEFLYSADP